MFIFNDYLKPIKGIANNCFEISVFNVLGGTTRYTIMGLLVKVRIS